MCKNISSTFSWIKIVVLCVVYAVVNSVPQSQGSEKIGQAKHQLVYARLCKAIWFMVNYFG